MPNEPCYILLFAFSIVFSLSLSAIHELITKRSGVQNAKHLLWAMCVLTTSHQVCMSSSLEQVKCLNNLKLPGELPPLFPWLHIPSLTLISAVTALSSTYATLSCFLHNCQVHLYITNREISIAKVNQS